MQLSIELTRNGPTAWDNNVTIDQAASQGSRATPWDTCPTVAVTMTVEVA